MPAFNELNLSQAMQTNLKELGYLSMTPIQAQSLPAVLGGKDVIAKAKTGSGKTAAFGIGLVEKLEAKNFRAQALVLCPTRELADQVAKELRRLARMTQNIKILTLCGGTPIGPQLGSLERGAHIVVGTPGRIADHLRKKSLDLSSVNTVVLDEADRMLDMGFIDPIRNILDHATWRKQTLLFSATFPEQIENISQEFQKDPIQVSVDETHNTASIEQEFYLIDKSSRMDALEQTLLHHQLESTVVFCHTKQTTADVARQLNNSGFAALALHGDLAQKERDQVLVRFANRSTSILVATDVAARGLDIQGLDLVVNYEIPREEAVYVHRIGRTGRSGQSGLAISFCAESETYKVDAIADYLKQGVELVPWTPEKSSSSIQPYMPTMITLQFDEGKKNKLRPGDILGALTGESGLDGSQVGKIDIFPFTAYVAVERNLGKKALKLLLNGKIKGRKIKVRLIDR